MIKTSSKNSGNLGDELHSSSGFTKARVGEKIAQNYLKRKGYQILDANYIPKFISGPLRGEVDIVAKKDGSISFIEVKTLLSPRANFSPEEKVNYQKQRKIIKTAENWLMEKKIPFNTQWQIDVIAIRINPDSKKAKLRHFKNIALV